MRFRSIEFEHNAICLCVETFDFAVNDIEKFNFPDGIVCERVMCVPTIMTMRNLSSTVSSATNSAIELIEKRVIIKSILFNQKNIF